MSKPKTSEETINAYIKQHNLEDSFIDYRNLYLYRKAQPERRKVGYSGNNVIFFEETLGSLKNRNYESNKEVTSWNLVYYNGETTQKVTQEWLESVVINFNGEYDKKDLINFLSTNTKRTNPLNPKRKRKARHIFLYDEEYEYVKLFLKKLRGQKDNA